MRLVQKQLSSYYDEAPVPRTQLAGTKHSRGGGAPSGPPQTKLRKATVPRTQLAGTKHGRGGGAPSGPPQKKLRSRTYAGILNIGNTCYVASALHALAATPALLDLLQAGGAVETATTPIADAVGHILVQLHTLYDAARVVSVKPLLKALSNNTLWTDYAPLQGPGQKDAAEFMEKLLEVMAKELRESQHPQYPQLCSLYWGQRVSATLCDCCAWAGRQTLPGALRASQHQANKKPEDAMFQQIVIPLLTRAGGQVRSIEQGLMEAFQPETMDGSNSYMCDTCRSNQSAVRQEKLTILPPQLNIVIARQANGSGRAHRQRVHHPIELDLLLDLSPHTTDERPAWYRLQAVVLHLGEDERGHYVALRQTDTGSWLQADDMSVTPCGMDEVCGERATENVVLATYRVCEWISGTQRTTVEQVLSSGESEEELVGATPPLNISLSRQDMRTLGPGEWLNDEVVNFFLNGICRRSKQRLHIMSTLWYTRMCFTSADGHRVAAEPDCAGVRRWTRKFQYLLEYDYIVVPVHLPQHWVLVVVNFAHRRIHYFDSLHAGAGDSVYFNLVSDNVDNVPVKNVRLWVDREYQHRNDKAMDWANWSYCSEPCPQQRNGDDCGVLMLLCALHIIRLGAGCGAPLPFRFDEQDTTSVRWWLIHCMLNGCTSTGTPYELRGDANADECAGPSAGASVGSSAAYIAVDLVSSSDEEDEEEEDASPAASTQTGVGDICQEMANHGKEVKGAVGSAREFGVTAVIGVRCREGCTTAGCLKCDEQDFKWMREEKRVHGQVHYNGEYKVVWDNFKAGDDNKQLQSEGYDPVTNPYPGYTWESADNIKGDTAGSTGTAAWQKFYDKNWNKGKEALIRLRAHGDTQARSGGDSSTSVDPPSAASLSTSDMFAALTAVPHVPGFQPTVEQSSQSSQSSQASQSAASPASSPMTSPDATRTSGNVINGRGRPRKRPRPGQFGAPAAVGPAKCHKAEVRQIRHKGAGGETGRSKAHEQAKASVGDVAALAMDTGAGVGNTTHGSNRPKRAAAKWKASVDESPNLTLGNTRGHLHEKYPVGTPLSLQWGSTFHGCVVVIPTPEQCVKPDRDTEEMQRCVKPDRDIEEMQRNQIWVWSTLDDSQSLWSYDSSAGSTGTLGSQVKVRCKEKLNTSDPQLPLACGERGVLAPATHPDWNILDRTTWTYPGHRIPGSTVGDNLRRWRWIARAYGLLCTNCDHADTAVRETDLRAARAVHKQCTARLSPEDHKKILSQPITGYSNEARTRLLCTRRRFEVWTQTTGGAVCPTCGERHVLVGAGGGHGVGSETHFKLDEDAEVDFEAMPPLVCKRCEAYTTGNTGTGCGTHRTFGREAGLYNPPVPFCLRRLSYAEEAILALIQPIVPVTQLARGTRSLRGSVCFVDRLEDVGEIATKLPRLASSIKIVVVERRKGSARSIAAEYSPLRVRKQNVMSALTWLRAFHPEYQRVEIDDAAVAALPKDGSLPVSVLVTDEEAEAGDPEPYGAASSQTAAPDGADDIQYSGIVSGAPSAGVSEKVLAEATRLAAGCVPDDQPNGLAGPSSQPDDRPEPVEARVRQEHGTFVQRWQDIPYFFSMAWPTLFMPNWQAQLEHGDAPDVPAEFTCNQTVTPREHQPTFAEFAKHLQCVAPFSSHASLHFALKSMKDIAGGLSNVGFAVNQSPVEEPLVAGDLQALLDDGDKQSARRLGKLATKVASFSEGSPGAQAYFWKAKRNLNAHIERRLFYDNELPILFLTGTNAEYHWPEVKRLLAQAVRSDGREAHRALIEEAKVLATAQVMARAQEAQGSTNDPDPDTPGARQRRLFKRIFKQPQHEVTVTQHEVLTSKYKDLRTEPIDNTGTDAEKRKREEERKVEQQAVENEVKEILQSFDDDVRNEIDSNPDLRALLKDAVQEANQADKRAAEIASGSRQGNALYRAIQAHESLLSEFFEARRCAFFKTVVTDGLGLKHTFCKGEFGSHGGKYHWHAVGWTAAGDTRDLTDLKDPDGDNGLDYLARSKNVEDSETREAKVAQTLGKKMVKVFGDEVTCLHPAGRKRTAETNGNPTWHNKRMAAARHRPSECREAIIHNCSHVCDGCAETFNKCTRTTAECPTCPKCPPCTAKCETTCDECPRCTPECPPRCPKCAKRIAALCAKKLSDCTECKRAKHYCARDDDTDVDHVGDVDRWPRPEGTEQARADWVSMQPLREKTYQTDTSHAAKEKDLIQFVNAVGVHSCTDYCLRLTNPALFYTCPCDMQGKLQTGTPCSCGDGVGSASAKKGSGSGSASAKKGSGSAKKTKDTRLRKKECRFGYGIENKIQKTRTNGIPAHNKARLTSSKTMTKFEPPRDHPRAVPGMRVVGRGWGANSDTQLIVAPKEDLPAEIEISSTPQFMKSLDEYCNVMNAQSGPESDFAKMKALRKQRGYMDKQGYTDAVENYLAEYICKEEASMGDITKLFTDIVRKASPGTPFRTLALQLQIKMLKLKHIASAEARWALLQLPLITSSIQFVVISRPGVRVVEETEVNPDGSTDDTSAGETKTTLKKNAWDKYLAAMNKMWEYQGQLVHEMSEDVCFDMHAGNEGKVCPVWTFWKTRAVWPLDSTEGESYCEDSLTRFKPVRALADVKGNHATYSAAMTAFLRHRHCPAGLQRQVARARLAVLFEEVAEGVRKHGAPRRKAHTSKRTGGGGGAASCAGAPDRDGGDGSDADDGDDSSALFDSPDDHDAPDEVPSDLNERSAGADVTSEVRPHLPTRDVMASWSKGLYTSLDEQMEPLVNQNARTRTWPDVFLANAKQRVLLADILWHLKDVAISESTGTQAPQFFGLCIGVAGTGKTFIQKFVKLFLAMFTLKSRATAMVAPTGAAARNCNGSTPERALGMPSRSSRKWKEMPAQKLGELQAKWEDCKCLLVDEVSMIGCTFMGQLARCCSCVFNSGRCPDDIAPRFGGLDLCLFFGDFCQLPPVCDPGGLLYSSKPLHADRDRVGLYGRAAYAALKGNCYELTEPVRQQRGEAGSFYDNLQSVRNGEVTAECMAYFNKRHRTHLQDHADNAAFRSIMDPDLLVLSCFAKDRQRINTEYFRTLEDCCRVRAVVTGRHAQSNDGQAVGMCKNIPIACCYAIGMCVKLTVNMCPEHGLCNGSRGKVVDIIYPSGDGYAPPPLASSDDPTVFPIVIVDFPHYTGHPLLTDGAAAATHPTLVPIVAITRHCNRHCCSREGLPLISGKADTAHSAQGISVGRGEAFKRALFLWTAQAESLWPGIFYVGVSRPKEASDFALQNALTKHDAASIGTAERAQEARSEMSDIGKLAEGTQKQQTRGFKEGLAWLCDYVTLKANTMYTSMDANDDEDEDVTQHRRQVQNVLAVCAQWQARLNSTK